MFVMYDIVVESSTELSEKHARGARLNVERAHRTSLIIDAFKYLKNSKNIESQRNRFDRT